MDVAGTVGFGNIGRYFGTSLQLFLVVTVCFSAMSNRTLPYLRIVFTLVL
jgi:hypothetical protein